MKFAQFQSTYKPLPIETYERTGQELEAKYYRNREQSSLLRQGLSNTKVEDRNIGHLAKAVTDVEGMLDEVNGKWHYASNTLYKAKDRLINDKVLDASIEDYAKSQTSKTEQQKRLEEGKIGQDALSAFYTYDKLYNNKAIEIDEQGRLKNRWITPTSPDKPDIDKKSMELVDMVLKNPSSIDTGLMSILNEYGMNTGYLERIRRKEVSPEQIIGVVKGFLANSDDVKDYYNYINKADLLSKTTQFDENGNTIERSILPTMVSEYRNMGWNVDQQGNLLDNYQHYINDRGEFDILKDKKGKSIELNNAPKSIYDDPTLKYYVNEKKLNAEDALKTTYLNRKLDSQLNSIADGYKKFAFSEVSHFDTTADQGHWLRAKYQIEEEMKNAITASTIGNMPLRTENYNIFDATGFADQLRNQLSSTTPDTPEYDNLQRQLNAQTNNIKVISKSFFGTLEGKELVNSLWKDLVSSKLPIEQSTLFSKYRKDFENYLIGEGPMPDLGIEKNGIKSPISEETGRLISVLTRSPFTAGMSATGLGTYKDYKVENAKQQFFKAINQKLKDGLTIDNKYKIFKTINNEVAPFHKQEGELIKKNGQSWILSDNTNKMGEPIKLQNLFEELFSDKYSIDWFDAEYFPSENTSTGYGEGILQLTPNKNFPKDKSIPKLDPITIRPDASISDAVLYNRAKFVANNTQDKDVLNWANTAAAMTLYGKTFAPVFSALATTTKFGNPTKELVANNVKYGNLIYDTYINITGDSNNKEYAIYFTPESISRNGANYPLDKPLGVGNSLNDAIFDLATKSAIAEEIENKARSTK